MKTPTAAEAVADVLPTALSGQTLVALNALERKLKAPCGWSECIEREYRLGRIPQKTLEEMLAVQAEKLVSFRDRCRPAAA